MDYQELYENPIPLWEKYTLSIAEAAIYTGIGARKLYQITSKENCKFVLWIGERRRIKRKELEKYIENEYSI